MKTYIEKYGIEQIKKNLKFKKRYFKTYSDYAYAAIEAFDSRLFKQDINIANFPIIKHEVNGWNLDKAPTAEQFEQIYEYLTK